MGARLRRVGWVALLVAAMLTSGAMAVAAAGPFSNPDYVYSQVWSAPAGEYGRWPDYNANAGKILWRDASMNGYLADYDPYTASVTNIASFGSPGSVYEAQFSPSGAYIFYQDVTAKTQLAVTGGTIDAYLGYRYNIAAATSSVVFDISTLAPATVEAVTDYVGSEFGFYLSQGGSDTEIVMGVRGQEGHMELMLYDINAKSLVDLTDSLQAEYDGQYFGTDTSQLLYWTESYPTHADRGVAILEGGSETQLATVNVASGMYLSARWGNDQSEVIAVKGTGWGNSDLEMYNESGGSWSGPVDLTGSGWSSTDGGVYAGSGTGNGFLFGVRSSAASDGIWAARAVPDVVYVDDDYSSGSSGGYAWGYDAFATIQEGIDAVTEGGTVNVAAGTYVEEVVVNKTVEMYGATAGVDKNGYAVPAGYAWDDTVETIIEHPDPVGGYTAIVDIEDVDDVVFDGFIVQEKNAVANQNSSLVRVAAHTREISNVSVVNCVIGPNTNVVSQDGTHGRMGLYIVNWPYNDWCGVVDSTFSHNKIFDTQGNGNCIFLWSSYYAYGAAGETSMHGTVIEENEIYGSRRSGFESAGGYRDLVIRDNVIYGCASTVAGAASSDLLKYGNGVMLIRGASDKMGGSSTAYGPVDLTIENNEIYDCGKNGIYMGPMNEGYIITGNDIHANGWCGIMLDLEGRHWNGTYEPAPVPPELYAVYDGSSNLVANLNDIHDNGQYGIRVAGVPTNGFVFDAEANHWGGPDGPGGEGPGAGNAVSEYVDYSPWTGSPAGTAPQDWHTNDSVQSAVDWAASDDGIDVLAGVYVEQIVIDAKDLTVSGAGDTSVIQSPNQLTEKYTSSADNYPVVLIRGGAEVTLDSLKVDGAGKGNAGSNYRFQGIGFEDAGGTIQNVTVADVRNEPLDGSQHGVGIASWNDDGTPRKISVLGCDIYGFQKNAMAIAADGSTPLEVDISGNTITGGGILGSGLPAQNGVQTYGDLITGAVADNVIADIAYSGGGWVATSILNYYAEVDITGNTITGSHMGIYNIDASGDISGNDLSMAKIGGYCWGIVASDPPDAVPSPFENETVGALSVGLKAPLCTDVVTVNNNTLTFSGPDNSGTYGIEADAGYGDCDLEISIDGNVVTGFDVGIEIYQGTTTSAVFTSVDANENDLSGNVTGIRSNADYTVVDGTYNYWGAASGPGPVGPGSGALVSDYVDYAPWYGDAVGSFAVDECEPGVICIEPGWTKEQTQAIIDSAPEGATLMLLAGPPCHPGDLVLGTPGMTVIAEPGACITFGSPAFTVTAPNVTIQGLELVGDGISSGIVVDGNADNCAILDCDIHDWYTGVQVSSSATSFKMVGNYVHDNDGAGLLVNSGVVLDGVVTIEGNLFKANTGPGVNNESPNAQLDCTYNSWGAYAGAAAGDGVAGDVLADPYTFVEPYMDMAPDTNATTVNVDEGDSFDVKLKVEANELRALDIKVTWDTDMMQLDSTTLASAFQSSTKIDQGSGPDTFYWTFSLSGTLTTGEQDVATLSFTAVDDGSHAGEPGDWYQYFDISHVEAETRAGAAGGVKIFVNNADYGATARDISDGDDGEVVINGIAQYTGFVDLQGRTNDAGATVSVSDGTPTLRATAISAPDGSYTTAYESGQNLVIGDSYDIVVTAPLFLPASRTSEPLDVRPLDTLPQVKLLGGDAVDDDVIDIGDVSLIGSNYGMTSGFAVNADVNIDNQVDILDLVLAAGNYTLTSSPWL